MPIYEYACQNCGHVLDVLQKLSDDPLVDCPECGQAELKRLLSAPRFRLKGEGWYETDFKKDRQRNVLKSDGEGGGKDDKSEKSDKAGKPDKAEPARETPGSRTEAATAAKPAKSAGPDAD